MLVACIALPTVWVPVTLPTSWDASPSDGALELGAVTAGGIANFGIFVTAIAAILVTITEPQPRNACPRIFTLEVLL